MSSLRDILSHPSFARIVGIGRPAIPLIVSKLCAESSWLFLALAAITGKNPVKSEHRGNLELMCGDWIDWASGR
jgi:hypothetical protein